ncbi:hypothetical protein [Saccharothrix yanglingensis]|nr:hypothetical protein [Saccharothrix yanglingensis]
MSSTALGGEVASWASFTDGTALRCEVGPDVAEFSFAGGQLEASFPRGALVTLIARSQAPGARRPGHAGRDPGAVGGRPASSLATRTTRY